jgi:hypothetical protein
MEIEHTTYGDAEPFDRATRITINWDVLTLCPLIVIVKFSHPRAF